MLCYFILLFASLSASASTTPNNRVADCDVVVIDGTLGGVAAAVQSARSGAKTCLTSMTDWLGGQMTVQGVPDIDLPYQFSESSSSFLDWFKKKMGLPHSKKNSGGLGLEGRPHSDEVVRTLMQALKPITRPVACWEGTYCYKPSEVNKAFAEFLAPYVRNGTLRIFLETVPKRVHKANDRIVSVDFVQRKFTGKGAEPYQLRLSEEVLDWYSEMKSARYTKSTLRLTGKIFIDASETGEIIVLSGAKHRLGNVQIESQRQDSECVMGFVYPVGVLQGKPSADLQRSLDSIVNPPGLEAFDIKQNGDFKFWNDDTTRKGMSVFDYRRMSDSPPSTALNWNPGNDYTRLNFIIPVEKLTLQMKDWKGGLRVEALDEAERRALAFTGWLNHQPEVTWNGRGLKPITDLHAANNFFGTGTGLSRFPYVRETRRMEGYQGFYIQPEEVTTDSQEIGKFPDAQYSNFFDSVGVGAYPLDGRPCPSGWRVGYKKPYSNHYQVPLRALISSNVPNLLSANKTLAVTQVTNSAYRLHPTEWNAGYGAGTAAGVAIKHRLNLHELISDRAKVKEVQSAIIHSGGRVLWFSDELPPDSAH